MTASGGTNGLGTIFKLMPDGTGYVSLMDFAGSTNGQFPEGPLISDGTFLYGVTPAGGTANLGVIFKIMITYIIILHILNPLKFYDKIMIMEKGKILEKYNYPDFYSKYHFYMINIKK